MLLFVVLGNLSAGGAYQPGPLPPFWGGYCTWPLQLDCASESICETCTHFQASIEWRSRTARSAAVPFAGGDLRSARAGIGSGPDGHVRDELDCRAALVAGLASGVPKPGPTPAIAGVRGLITDLIASIAEPAQPGGWTASASSARPVIT